MSWDADLACSQCGRYDHNREWNYTHNCNGMIEAVLADAEIDQTRKPFWSGNNGMGRGAWWDLLDGKTGSEGKAFLDRIIEELEADPERFRGMNPSNGWGDYDSLLSVLREMSEAVPNGEPTTWRVSG